MPSFSLITNRHRILSELFLLERHFSKFSFIIGVNKTVTVYDEEMKMTIIYSFGIIYI